MAVVSRAAHQIRSVFLEDLTSPEVHALMDQGWTRVIVTSGSIEQQGPHMPLDADSTVAKEVARRLANRLGKTLVAPVIPMGCSDYHLSFPGTVSVRESVFGGVLEDLVGSLIHHGFSQVLITSFHGGNFEPSENTARRLKTNYPEIDIRTALDLDQLLDVGKQVIGRFFPQRDIVDCHAACFITSMQACVDKTRIRQDKVEDGAVLKKLPIQLPDIKDLSDNGVIGLPTGYSEELGETLFDAVVQLTLQSWKLT